MPSGKHNSIMAKAISLIFSLFGAASAGHVPFDILQNIQCILHELTTVLFIFTDSKRCQFGGSM